MATRYDDARGRRSCSTAKRRYQRGDRETEQKGWHGKARGEGGERGRKTGTFAYMVTDYRGTKGRRALGPLFLEETRRSFSLPHRHPSPRLLRVPYSELLITFACISPLFLPHALGRSSRCSLLLQLRLFLALSFCLLFPSPFLSFSLSVPHALCI